MKSSTIPNKFWSPALVLAPVLVYVLTLLVRLPVSFTRFFWSYSIGLFTAILILYFVGYSFGGKIGWLAASSITMLLFGLTLSYAWTSGHSDAGIIGGMIPYKDSYHYYNGARLILNGSLLPDYSLQAAWRPLFPGFLASLLLVTQHNLQLTLAILMGLAGFCMSLAGQRIHASVGNLGASIFMTLLFLYIQPKIGDLVTEVPGLVLGCMGFVLLWEAAQRKHSGYLVFGLIVLMLAVSMRAGAFFVFPMLVLWAGWQYRKNKRFSFRTAGIATALVLVSYFTLNSVYTRLITTPGSQVFGNFAYTIYGQVMGGTGYERAMVDLGTQDSSLIYQAAWQAFINHPISLLIGSAKAYRDFFLPTNLGIFEFVSKGGLNGMDIFLWISALLLLVWGSVQSIKEIRSPTSSLLLFAFIGVLLSIPFLPPIDGGGRFYASTMPFFFALLVLPTIKIPASLKRRSNSSGVIPISYVVVLSGLALFITAILPILIQRFSTQPIVMEAVCPANQVPFAVEVDDGSYIDLIPAGVDGCGFIPSVCLEDFDSNGTQRKVDDFYRKLLSIAEGSSASTRIMAVNDLVDGGLHYYVGDSNLLDASSTSRIVTGCARKINTQYQNIYLVLSTAE